MRPKKHARHLPARMYYKHGAYWYVLKGKWTRLDKDLAPALSAYAKLIAPEAHGAGMGDLIDKVFEHHVKKLRPNTISQYRLAAQRLKNTFIEFSPDQVRPRDVAALKQHLASTPNMANRILSFLRIVFDYAVEWQIVESNPCIGIKRLPEAKRKRYMTDAEFATLRSHAQHIAIPVVMDLCFLTGQRIGDVLGIKNSDITDEGIYFASEKTDSRLMVCMTPDLAEAIALARRTHPPHERAETLLYTRGYKPYSYGAIKDAFNRTRDLAKITDVTIHDMRAKSLTDADGEGKDPQKLGGHSDRRMTERYIRVRRIVSAEPPTMPKKGKKT